MFVGEQIEHLTTLGEARRPRALHLVHVIEAVADYDEPVVDLEARTAPCRNPPDESADDSCEPQARERLVAIAIACSQPSQTETDRGATFAWSRARCSTEARPEARRRANELDGSESSIDLVNSRDGNDDHTANTPPGRGALRIRARPVRRERFSLVGCVIALGPLSTSSEIAL